MSCFALGCLLSIGTFLVIVCAIKRKNAGIIVIYMCHDFVAIIILKINTVQATNDQEVSTTRNEAYEVVLKHYNNKNVPQPIYESVDQNLQT